MIKLGGSLCSGSKLASRSSFWCFPSHQSIALCSKTATASKTKVDKQPVTNPKTLRIQKKENEGMVAQVFNKLNTEVAVEKNKSLSSSVKAVNDILSNSEGVFITDEIALKSIRDLCQLVDDGKIRPEEFEKDWRYQKLCRVLAKKSKGKLNHPQQKKNIPAVETSPMNYVYGINDFNETFDDIKDLSLSQIIQIFSRLATKQKRSKPLLLALAENIKNSSAAMDIKNIADIFYSMARLNFPDEGLLEKLCTNLQKVIHSVDQSPVIGSIVTSIGMLRYRDDRMLDELCKWAIEHKKILRTQDLCALLITLATVGYIPPKADIFFEDLIGVLKETDMIKSSEWVDVVWSLTVLNKATPAQISSALNDNFLRKFSELEELPLAKRHKLLNINAAAKSLLKDYKGSMLKKDSVLFEALLSRTKDKEVFIKAITDALANLFPSRDHFRTNVDNGSGFLIDVEFFMDDKYTPLVVEKVGADTKALKIAILAHYYHDYCLGKKCLMGSALLHQRLLEADGYRIIDISHSDFHADDKLLKRITFINDRIKSIAK